MAETEAVLIKYPHITFVPHEDQQWYALIEHIITNNQNAMRATKVKILCAQCMQKGIANN